MTGALRLTPTSRSTLQPAGTLVSVLLCARTLPAWAGFCRCATLPSTRPTALSCLTASASDRPCRFGTVTVAVAEADALGRAEPRALGDGLAVGVEAPLGTSSQMTTPRTRTTSAATASSHQGLRLGA